MNPKVTIIGPIPANWGKSRNWEAEKWPVTLCPMKLLAQPGDTGLGDIIERTIGPVGGNQFKAWYKTTFGRECRCNIRKENWNKRYPLESI